jgi:phosphoglycerate kinase
MLNKGLRKECGARKWMIRWVDEIPVANRRIFLRVDFNVPLKKGEIQSTNRIQESLPTLQWLVANGGRIILASHLGRPQGRFNPSYSMAPVAREVEKLTGYRVVLAPDSVGAAVRNTVQRCGRGEVVCLENLRFHPEEEKNDPAFARALAGLADVYINDAFGTVHRAHASTAGVPSLMQDKGGGFLLKKEITALEKVLLQPERPLLAILGGAKVSDKIEILDHLIDQTDGMLLGGGMALTFLFAQGLPVGASRVEADKVEVAKRILKRAASKPSFTLFLPIDHIVASSIEETAEASIAPAEKVPEGCLALDIGPATRRVFQEEISRASTIIWNGPMGVFEVAPFSEGTMAIARAVAYSGAETLVGGGDTVAALAQSGCAHLVGHISTGGGATLEFLSGKPLPGIESLRQ